MTTSAALPAMAATADDSLFRRRRYTDGRRGRRLAVRGGGALAVGVSAGGVVVHQILFSGRTVRLVQHLDGLQAYPYIGCIWTPASG